jgi:capsular polysaccharide export protein
MAGRVVAVSGGFLGPSAQARRIRRILTLAGAAPRLAWPGPGDGVLAWGHAPRAARAEVLAARTGAALWRIEDAWLRSVHPARAGGEGPMGLLVDRSGGIHYDPRQPSDLETLLATHPLDDPALLARADLAIDRLRHLHLSKYNAHDPALPVPDPGYVLVIDQVRGDASLRHGGLTGPLGEAEFAALLERAKADHPDTPILIRAHPETALGARAGHFGPSDAGGRVRLITGQVSPWALLAGARAVYTVSSQLGFEAILAGHRPVVAGLPFYAGWGLSTDLQTHPRRRRVLTAAQLFAGASVLFPLWYDPLRDRLCQIDEVIDQLDARARAWREDRAGYVATGMRAWKRGPMQGFFGAEKPVRFVADPVRAAALAQASGRRLIGWAGAVPRDFPGLRVEDGLMRSRGLGAELVPPLSLMVDDLGIYYDPTRPSRLEALIAAPLPPGEVARAAALRAAVVAQGVTKYNLGGADPAPRLATLRAARPGAPVILVPGQVEDDASIRLGATGPVRTNRDLLVAARAAHPGAVLIYKPHPDVEAGLRPGAVADAGALADWVADRADAAALLAGVDAVWTLTSGLGFEALMRGVPVTCLGAPFYAGWGLTTDLAPVPDRRGDLGEGGLDRLVHAVLIAAPRGRDPVTGAPCPPELLIERLALGQTGARPWHLRALARVQGWLSGHAWLWRGGGR